MVCKIVGGYSAILYQTRTKESEEYSSKVADQEHKVRGDFCRLLFTTLIYLTNNNFTNELHKL